MDKSNGRPTQGAGGAVGDSSMETGEWRDQLQADSRQRMVNKIMDTLKRHLPFSEHEGPQELEKIAVRFEEKIYTAATSQSDYMRKVCLKMLTMETRPLLDEMHSNSAANSINPSDPGSQVIPQVNHQGQQLPIPVPSSHTQPGQQMMSQNIHNNTSSAGIHGSSSLSALPPGSGLPQSTMETGDWRDQLQADSRQRIVKKIMDTLKRHLPFSEHEGPQELEKIAVRFEEKIYTAATSQSDYLRKISLKMLTMVNRSQNPMPDAMQSNSAANSINPSDPGSQVIPQVNHQRQQLSIPVPSSYTQPGQQMMSQNIHNIMSSAGIHGSSSLSSALPPGGGLPQSTMETGDWRDQLQADSRQRMVNKIMDTLKRHLPFSEHEGPQELEKIAVRFEEKIYTAATSQSDYLRKISLKMLTMENRSQNPMPDAMQSNSAANRSLVIPQVNHQGQQLPIPVPSSHTQPGQQMMSQNIHNNTSSAGIHGSSSLSSALPPGSGLPQSTMETGDWRDQLQADSRPRVVNKIMDTLKRHLPFSEHEGPQELKKIAVRFEEKIYTAATSQMDYLRKLSLKMLTMEQLHQLAKPKLQQSNITPTMQSDIQQQQK